MRTFLSVLIFLLMAPALQAQYYGLAPEREPVSVDPNSPYYGVTTTSAPQDNCPTGVCPTIPSNTLYSRQWVNRDGLSVHEHAVQKHGRNVYGLNEAEVAKLLDQDHNAWGTGSHPVSSSSSLTLTTSTYAAPSRTTLDRRVRLRNRHAQMVYQAVQNARFPRVARIFPRWALRVQARRARWFGR